MATLSQCDNGHSLHAMGRPVSGLLRALASSQLEAACLPGFILCILWALWLMLAQFADKSSRGRSCGG